VRLKLWRRIGWRNLGRNRRRALITAAGLAFGYFAVVLVVGLMTGLTAEMIDNGTGIITGQLQVHDVDYRPERSIYETIGGREGTDVRGLVRRVADDPAVAAAAPRVYAGGLVSSGEATTAGILMGIDPVLEPRVSRLTRGLVEGTVPAEGTNGIMVGTEMARQLAVGVGDEVILVAPAADGSMGNDLYTVSGIFRSGMTELDAAYALLPLGALQLLIALDSSRIHEIAGATADPWLAPEATERLRAEVAPLGLEMELEPWTTLRPEMLDYAQLVKSWNIIVIGIVFAIAVFGVANTMLMATFERRREFAVIMALGASPVTVVFTVLFEAIALGLVSLVAGAVITYPVLVWWHVSPPDVSWLYGDFTMFGALIRPVLRVEYDLPSMVWAGAALLLTALLASLYPAVRAARVPPADTLAGD
jgi:ABC-type lipoprotein release transport system permease subunit